MSLTVSSREIEEQHEAPQVDSPTPPRHRRHWPLNVFFAALISLLVVLSVGTFVGWWSANVVLTGSMRPTIDPGDVVIVLPESPQAVAAGQILAFHPPGESITVTHRVWSVEHRGTRVIVRTKGDANNSVDPWRARIVGNAAWRVVAVIPKIGYPALWIRTSLVRYLAAGVAGIIAIWLGFEYIWREEKRRT